VHTTVSLAEPEAEQPEQSEQPAARAGDRDRTPSFTYQPALDGLRALAVLGVLLYHAGVSWAPGGFLGVDAFFVLSGFLITSLLVDEWRTRGRIDFRAFWARRARRLLPALVLVVVAVGVYAVFVARPDELQRIRGDTFGSLLYVANWRQLFESSYFAKLATPSPLRHTWSLGIEEQWYLVWPLALVLMVRVTAGRRWAVIGITIGLAFGSAALMAALFDSGDPTQVPSDVNAFANFMRFLDQPIPLCPGTACTSQMQSGSKIFVAIGCANCHTPSLTTTTSEMATGLSQVQANLFSDLALHHMGGNLADGITQGNAGPDQFRTAPLWGVGQRVFFLHDGRTSNMAQSILEHEGSGSEANRVIENFEQLSRQDKENLILFLRSL